MTPRSPASTCCRAPASRRCGAGRPSAKKDADWAPILELEDVKAVGRATGTTVNDVMISAVAIGLTRYLNEKR